MTALRFAHPEALLLFLLVPAALALARGRVTPGGALGLRALVMAALVLSLAAPQFSGGGTGQHVVFAVDLSESISPGARADAVEFAREAASRRRPADRIGAVTFAADAVVEEAPSDAPALAFTTRPVPGATDIAQAIRTALATMPAGGARRIILATDGNANRGDLDQALALARSQGVEISVVPLLSGSGDDVLVEEVLAPSEVRTAERFTVRIALASTAEARVQLRVAENDAEIARRTVALAPGRTVISVGRVAQREGLLRYTAEITATPDVTTANNVAAALVAVRGAPVVWYVAGDPGPLPQVLRAQGLRVVSMRPESLPGSPAEYRTVAAVVLDDVAAPSLSAPQQGALRDFVGALGGGLVVVGGPRSFGVGGYARTPLEEALPVSMDVRHRLALPSMAIILVIDTSGSMGAFGQQIAKVELAKETAQSVIDLLGERDIIGVVSFDQEPRWLVTPTEARNREQVMDQVARVRAGGGTNMHPALRLAYDYLRRSPAKIRHVIVISDGQTDPGDFEGLVTRLARDRVTTSAVAVGGDADEQIMRSVARWGGGRYYLTRDLYSVPQILTAEALLASRAYIIEERLTPELRQRGLVDDFTVPALRGYVATAPKPAGTVHLASPADDPILAVWQYGLGRAAAFTSDARARWAAEWMAWPDLARFWGRLVRWSARDDADGLIVSIEQVDAAGQRAAAGGSAAIVLDVFTPAGEPVDGLQAEASVAGPAGVQSVRLVQSAPGRYEGQIVAARPGSYAVTVAARAGETARLKTTGFVVPYSPELRDLTVNRALLARIVEATGGTILTDPRQALAPTRSARTPVDGWPYLVTLAVGFFLAEITWRRVPAIAEHLRIAFTAIGARLRRQPAPDDLQADRFYEEADRWKLIEGEPSEGAESMEAAARLYIARLKAAQAGERSTEPPAGVRPRESTGADEEETS
ncbi:MAG TPA: VWA domain-containing protein [bacterium]|nr:VWA domain-containing protein [bacterium]